MGKASFKWGDGEITVTNSTVRTRIKRNLLNRLAGLEHVDEPLERESIALATFYLSHVDRVEGDVGFVVPNGNADSDNVHDFIDAFLASEERLMSEWDNAIVEASDFGNDPDLVPPQEVPKND